MGTMASALRAKEKTKQLLKGLPGIDGIGIAWDDEGKPCVRVNVDVEAKTSREKIPASVDGIPVKVEFIHVAELE
ncbi:MAG: hypothetical protein ACXWID_04550 [Pyrinomonadaceae bacterium]